MEWLPAGGWAAVVWSAPNLVTPARFAAVPNQIRSALGWIAADADIDRLLTRSRHLDGDMPLLDVPDPSAKLRILELDSVPLTLAGNHIQHGPFFGHAERDHAAVGFHENRGGVAVTMTRAALSALAWIGRINPASMSRPATKQNFFTAITFLLD